MTTEELLTKKTISVVTTHDKNMWFFLNTTYLSLLIDRHKYKKTTNLESKKSSLFQIPRNNENKFGFFFRLLGI